MAGKKIFLVNNRFPLAGCAALPVSMPFSVEQTTALFTAFLQDTVQRFTDSGIAALRIVAHSETEIAPLQELFPEADIRAYTGDTPGDILSEAVEEAFNEGMKQIIVIDSAVPTVPIRIIQSGMSLLDVFEDAFTVAPIERGGFYSIGMNGYHPEILRGIDPTTEDGYQTLIGRICEFDSSVYILQSWYDIRQSEDLVQLQGEISNNPDSENSPEHTRAALENISLDSLLPENIPSGES